MKRHYLLIDCSFIRDKNWCESALALYAGRLLQGFRNSEVFDISAIVWKGFESYIDRVAGYEVPKIIIDGHHYVTPWPIVDRILGLISIKIKKELENRKIDIVLSPYHFECRLFFPPKYHQHAIVHDLFFYDNMKEYSNSYKYWRGRLYHKLLHHKISYYVSISEETRKALKHIEGINSVVVYNSIPFDFSIQEDSVECLKGKPYILNVNRLQKYKNVETLVRAFYIIKNEIPHILYIKGDKRNLEDNKRLEKMISELLLDDRVIIDCSYRSEGEMRYLYRHADLFVTPSLKEGFGWTPIEAAILETPVLISDIDVLKEVSCNKLPTFNPHSPEELAVKMRELIENPPSIENRKQLSKFYMERYSLKRQINNLTDVMLRSI
jgi:glycosyltransferase involved in cell wall biosynthesis